MDAEWISSPAARRILAHWADPRPAWLWSAEGNRLIWRNEAARLFNARLKKSGLRLSETAVPIKGLVARLVRLGSIGRSSLSRVQFLAGGKPVAGTCSCTPLLLPRDEAALLLVAVEPIADEVRDAAGDLGPDPLATALFPPNYDYRIETGVGDASEGEIRLPAGPGDQMLVLRPAVVPAADEAQSAGPAPSAEAAPLDEQDSAEAQDLADIPEPMLPLGLDPLPETAVEIAETEEPAEAGTETDPAESGALSSLFDRLAGESNLFEPLTAADDDFAGDTSSVTPVEDPPEPPEATEPAEPPETRDLIATVIDYADDPEEPLPPAAEPPPEPPAPEAQPPTPRTHWMITGRGFRVSRPETPEPQAPGPVASEPVAPGPVAPEAPVAEAPVEQDPAPAPGPEETVAPAPAAAASADDDAADRVSRYNFEELGRILADRVNTEPREESPTPALPETPSPAPANGIINLNAETLVLNRLPLAILVFRDQQVLFANRALTDLLGHESVESLRAAGIGAVFPSTEATGAGPVNRLTGKDGRLIPVNARLQSVSWQGRAALMLSASSTAVPEGHEAAVRSFAELAAEIRGEGFLRADRAGVVTYISAAAAALLHDGEAVKGQPLAKLVTSPDAAALREFLEKPARFAETVRPYLVATANGGHSLALFAEGQAGLVTGYFGVIGKGPAGARPDAPDETLDPGLLGRVSRGLRRPLNTVIGFADLLRTSTAAEDPLSRTAEYARDIRTAGLEMAALVDELDDYTRLREGHYAARPADVDLTSLLESSAVRVKAQASANRVLVRSAIPEQLPRIRADRASLGQALLNLLASAIDQTPVGGSVILSARSEDDGSIAIHLRDGALNTTDPGERFVVFRDGVDKDGGQLQPVRSTVGLALTRSLLAVNACSLSVDPTAGTGTLFTLVIPAELVDRD